ncbi:amidohydrolase family protein [Microtetraspora niveoalba]|uniref:amidohydrolase family protein n=1 Tax=Microtetraspora niveoalba TaxID=46175 RepID=UPI0008321AEC|nr:amidohydrolase family protein [Microtetraspora niveoalba]
MSEGRAAAGRILIKGGTVVTMDPAHGDLDRGDVLVENGRIAQVGADLEAPGAEVVDASGKLVIPGLIDTHLHMWQHPLAGLGADLWSDEDYGIKVFPVRERFTARDMYESTYTCAVEALSRGTTTVLNFCHNVLSEEHAEESLRAHRALGQRVLFAYGMLGHMDRLAAEHGSRLAHLDRIRGELAGDRDGLIRLGIGVTSLEYGGMELVRKEIEYGREHGLMMTIHQNPPGQILEMHQNGLLGADLVPVHANVATDHELGLLGACGCCVSFTTEGEFGGGRSMGVIARADRAGVRPTLGVDVPSAVAVDMFSQLRITLNIMRAVEAQVEREAGRWPLSRHPGSPLVSARRVLEYATVNAARAVGLADEIGSITPGKQADLVLLNTGPFGIGVGDPANHIVLQSTAADVDTVLVAGRFQKRAGELIGVDMEALPRLFQGVRGRVLGVS